MVNFYWMMMLLAMAFILCMGVVVAVEAIGSEGSGGKVRVTLVVIKKTIKQYCSIFSRRALDSNGFVRWSD